MTDATRDATRDVERGATQDVHGATRERLLQAAYACVARFGIRKTTIDDVARESGLSRATIYRYFPGGKEQLIRETVTWEVSRFYDAFVEVMSAPPRLTLVVEAALVFMWRSAEEHDLLQRLLAGEPDQIVPLLTLESPAALKTVSELVLVRLEQERAEGRTRASVDLEAAADYVARMVMSFASGRGSWNLDDPEQVATVARGQVLVGILTPEALAA